jgi:hypothetical protein
MSGGRILLIKDSVPKRKEEISFDRQNQGMFTWLTGTWSVLSQCKSGNTENGATQSRGAWEMKIELDIDKDMDNYL